MRISSVHPILLLRSSDYILLLLLLSCSMLLTLPFVMSWLASLLEYIDCSFTRRFLELTIQLGVIAVSSIWLHILSTL